MVKLEESEQDGEGDTFIPQSPPLQYDHDSRHSNKLGRRRCVALSGGYFNQVVQYVQHYLASLTNQYLPRLLGEDSIYLEDAIGRQHILPIRDFCRWSVLSTYLDHVFHGMPGSHEIRCGLYSITVLQPSYLTRRETDGSVVSEKTWESLVRPGDRVLMSVVFVVPRNERLARQVRRPGCAIVPHVEDKDSPSEIETYCVPRGTNYSLVQARPSRHVTPSDGDQNEISMLDEKRMITHEDEKDLMDLYFHPEMDSFASTVSISAHKARVDQISTSTDHRINSASHPLRRAILLETDNVLILIATISQLIDRLLASIAQTPRTNSSTIEQLDLPRLRLALSDLHTEALRHDELNFLDFENEHKSFMKHACKVIPLLHQYLKHIQTDNTKSSSTTSSADQDTASTSDEQTDIPRFFDTRSTPTTLFAEWIERHFLFPDSPHLSQRLCFTKHEKTTLVLIKTLTGDRKLFRISLSACQTYTVRQLKDALCRRDGTPVRQMYLVAKGKKIEDHWTLREVGLDTTGLRWYVHYTLPIWVKDEEPTTTKYTGVTKRGTKGRKNSRDVCLESA